MKASFLDLRRNPGKILDAINREETVTLSRRGKTMARIVPIQGERTAPVETHPAFGMWRDRTDLESPAQLVRRFRKGRFDAL
ncbi:MAG: type II toxin-antitoxin system prevent-host-death family antitoxin [Candidatus Omnitrophica bacterium]|nr:hypothetical protein [bacterium]NUN95391.1 type II toxin-antitoxin system prevent-host-death family antitoxin [Candidatus Omnitrophota bacterium]